VLLLCWLLVLHWLRIRSCVRHRHWLLVLHRLLIWIGVLRLRGLGVLRRSTPESAAIPRYGPGRQHATRSHCGRCDRDAHHGCCSQHGSRNHKKRRGSAHKA
jgi:hypothetical protein